MPNISLQMIIAAILLVTAILFYIHYRQEKNYRKALSMVTVIILTAFLGLLMQEAFRQVTDSRPPASGSTGTVTDDEGSPESEQMEDDAPLNIKSAGDFFYFISPFARKFVRNRYKFFSPDWFLILLSLLASFISFVVALTEIPSERKTVLNVTLGLFTGLIFSFISSYTICFLASSMIQDYGFSIPGVIVAIMGYWMILIALILILLLEHDFIELVLEFSPS